MSSLPLETGHTALEIYLLGRFHVVVLGRAIVDAEWRLRKAKQLIKLLALAPAHTLHREPLTEALWPELEPDAGANNLHKVLHVARRTLDPDPAAADAYLHLQKDLVTLRSDAGVWTDVEAFQRAAQDARRTPKIAAYGRAIEIYAGELLPEDRYEDWAAGPREELRDLYLSLLLEQSALQEAAGDIAGAVETLRRVVVEEPIHEAAHVGLMRLHAQAGHRHQGLRQFHKLRDALRSELDAEPGPAAQGMYQAVLSGELPSPPGPAPTSPGPPGSSITRLALPPLAGRGEEMDRLEEVLDDLFMGKGNLVLLRGEAGVGKSRLAQEVLQRAARRGAQPLWGAAYEQERQLPYGPFAEALQALPPNMLPQELEGLVRGHNAQFHEPPKHAALPLGLPEMLPRDRQRLFISVANLMAALATRSPVVLGLDDLQAADEASLELLHFLARTHRESPLLVIGTFRPEDLEQAPRLGSFLAAAQRERLALRMDLQRLGPHESESLLGSLLGPAPIDRDVFDTVYAFSEGNPFYTEEFVRSLRESGDLALVDGRWRLNRTALAVPQALAEVIAHRFRRLRAPALQALSLMSVIGVDVPYPLLRAAVDLPESELLDGLDDALLHRAIEESAEGYRFAHPLQRTVLYQQLSRARRASLHGHIAGVLEAMRQGQLDDHAPELAHHYSLSEEPRRAVPHLRTAARRAAAVFANEQAVRTYQQAIAILDAQGSGVQAGELATLLEEEGDVLQRMGGTGRSEPLYGRAARLMSEQGDDTSTARLRAKAALSAITDGDIEHAGELLRATLEAMNEKWPQLVVARTYYALAQLRWHSAQHQEALAAAELALRAAGASDDIHTKAQAYEVMALACHSLGDWQKGIEYELQRNALGLSGFDTDEAFDAHL